jgi:hypothetical protein
MGRILGSVPAEDDRSRDAPGPADGQGGTDADATWANAVAPDDLSGLARDVAAYHRELRQARRHRRTQSLLARRSTIPLLVIGGATLLAGLIAVMLTLVARGAVEPRPAAAALAHPAIADGALHGLLPNALLQGPNGKIRSRAVTLRPAVFALIPTRCDCGTLLNALAGQAYSENLGLAVVVPAASDAAAASMVSALARGSAGLYFDATGALNAAVGAEGVTLVVISRDGTIYDIKRSVTDPATTSLDATLQSMLLPARSLS